VGSTVPANGDQNPYGIVIAQETYDSQYLVKGDILISNFNNQSNLQGTGSTIVRFRNGVQSLFAYINSSLVNCPGGIGLTTALEIVDGWVIVGSLPTQDGTTATAGNGCLIILDSKGEVKSTIYNSKIRGPWDMTAGTHNGRTYLFVTNVLNGDVRQNPQDHIVNEGTVIRIELDIDYRYQEVPRVLSTRVIGSGFATRGDPNALILGPTGLALNGNTLLVADTLINAIAQIPNAFERYDTAYTGLDLGESGNLTSPLGLLFSKSLGVVAANGGNSLLVFIDEDGNPVKSVDTGVGAGGLFGIAAQGDIIYSVNDNNNTLFTVTDF